MVLEALENAQIGLIILLDDGSDPLPVYVSDRFVEIAGYDRDELMQRPALSYVAPEEVGRMRALRERYVGGEATPPSWETVLIKKSGERVPI